ncbi:Type 1 glutamine amidotransferase-like domain-containing protein [Aeromicrobium sp.]|nr:Type 1 glutamine amidotransferase-like domain-containing protein [Candidatus Saccharibacteria bacterium]
MKLYLSSYGFGNRPEEILKLAGANLKVASIMNAYDYQATEQRTVKGNEQLATLRELGFEPEEVDLRDYFGKSGELAAKFQLFGVTYVGGGNTFLLRTAMQLSGLDRILVTRIRDDSLLYAGSSAGSCVLSPTLGPLAVMDDPEVVQQVYGVPAVTSGLGILEYVFVPHYMSDHPASDAAEKAVDAMEKAQISHMALTDGEVLIIDGDGSEETVVS